MLFEFFLVFCRILWNECDRFECSFYYPCLGGAVLAPLTLKQEVVGSRLTLFTIFYYKFCTEFH